MTLDPVRERFAQEYHKHGNASEAYRQANPKAKKWKPQAVHVEACNTLKEPKVSLRLSELQQLSAEKHQITIESITQMLLEDRKLAHDTMKASAATQAAMGLAKIHGLVVEKSEVTGKDGSPLVPVLNVNVARDKP